MRWLLYLMVALGLTGFVGVAWVAMHPPAPLAVVAAAPPPPPVVHPHVNTVVAARPLHAGALLGPDDVVTHEIEVSSTELQSETPITREDLLGGMVRHNFPAGAPLHSDSVLRPKGRGFLAAVLNPGMRAVSVGVDPVSGAAGLIWPDDRVDVVLTQTVDGSQGSDKRISGETILTDLRVIAIDQQLMQGTVGSENAEHTVHTVTLEVTSAQAERIAVGARLGHLSLAVHASRADEPADNPSRPQTVTWASDVSSAVTNIRPNESLHLYSGPDKIEEMHF